MYTNILLILPLFIAGVYTASFKKCGQGKVCVSEYLCLDGTISKHGAEVFDIRDENSDMECPYFECCCSIADIVNRPMEPHRNSSQQIQEKENVGQFDKFPRMVASNSTCGHRNVDGIGFAIEGTDSKSNFGEFPWMMAVLRMEKTADATVKVYKCGGSLITPQVVLTAAHCVHVVPAHMLNIRAGEWDVTSKQELYSHQDREVVEKIIHENFNQKNLHKDIALLFVGIAFNLAPNVQPICLPPGNFNFDSLRCYATGWGKDKYVNGHYTDIMKKVELPAIPHSQCEMNLRKTRLSKYFALDKSFMCAGGERGKDMCKGDCGSPLVCPISGKLDRFYQVGIVAWGINCGEEDVPGVYANVVYFRHWIDVQLAKKKIDPAYYTPDFDLK